MVETRPMAIVTGPGTVELQERTLPTLGPHDVRIRVKAVTICGSDLHIFKGRHPAAPLPVPVGHEIAGEVSAVGDEVTRVRPGDRVAVEPVIACGTCHFCRRGTYHLCTSISFQYRVGQGGLTPAFVAPERWVHPLPPTLSFAAGALIEPLAVAVHAVGKAQVGLGQRSAIFGDGAIGQLLLMVARAAGSSETYLAGVNDFRLEKALELGATAVFDNRKADRQADTVSQIVARTGGLGVDRAFEAVGIAQTLQQSLQVLQKGGTAVLVGLFEDPEVTLPANIFVQKEIALVGSQGYCWDFQRALELVAAGQIDLEALITHHFSLSEVQEAFDLLLAPKSQALKVVIDIA